ncbi:DR2241 family protein [Haladaptatus sp. NG-WS-4]
MDALVKTATEGVDFDGLRVEHDENEGFSFETPQTTREDLTESAFRAVAREHPRYVSNWHYWNRVVAGHGTHRRAFLRWLERANRPVPERYDALAETGTAAGTESRPGISRTWGQLTIGVSLSADGDESDRRYEVRHVDDRDVNRATLTTYDHPTAIRDLSRFTDDGTYRPLKTSPTLPRGWSFTTSEGDDLYRVVEHVYPATVANWYREREGALDVTHFNEASDRQTGIYADVGELGRDVLGHAVERRCVDSQCLKRRAWDASEDDEIDVPRGDGEFPCREPCSLFVAGARERLEVERADVSRRGDADDADRPVRFAGER